MIPVETLFLPVSELAERVRTRQIDPVDLAEAYLARLESIGPRLNAVVTVTRERALREARAARGEIAAGRYRGPLHGIPYGVKDLIAAVGYPTTWGAQPYREQRFDEDATVVRKLGEAGAVLVAKLASVELAGGMGYEQANASFTGPGLTPWNTAFWSGGSSSGPGAAVAAGLVPFALGTETWGSIVTPAAFCGVTGLRPTYGRVSRHGAMALSWSMDKLGPLARSADDAGLVLSVIAGRDPLDDASADRPFVHHPSAGAGRRPRIGILKGLAEGSQAEVARNFAASIEALSDGAEIVRDVTLPKFPYGAAAGVIIDAEAASIFEELVDTGRVHELTAPEDRIGGYPGQVVFAKDYLRAMRIRVPAAAAMDKLFADGGFDALAHPTRATVSYPIGRKFSEAYPDVKGGGEPISGAANLLGLPSIAVPNGFGANGLPTSLSLTGRAWDEEKLIALARTYQQKTDWHRRRPPVS
ncbi:MAG TPA: amidase [Longimicrobiaceae bacterium]|nr:amidase [Longimicrobiaceae bacterium]